MRLRHIPIAVAAACLASLAGANESNGVKLPDIGSSAASLATPQELRDYGAGMLQEMRAYEMVLDDPLLSDYVNSLGYRLVASSERPWSGSKASGSRAGFSLISARSPKARKMRSGSIPIIE